MEKSIIQVRDFTMAYDEKPVIWDVDVDFMDNSVTAIIGPNGAGKSTLLKGMLGLMKPLTGSALFWGQEYKAVKDKIAYVPQTESVNWNFPISVIDVVMMATYGKRGMFSRINKEDKLKAMKSLEQMEMTDYANRHIFDLSGGQKQRVFIARAINQDAQIYIMDEPLAGIDKNTEKIIIEKFRKFKNEGKTVIAVHHDINTLTDYFDHVLVIDKVLKTSGSCIDVFKDKTPMEWIFGDRRC